MSVDVVLRDVTDADLPILFQHQADPEAAAMAAFPTRDRDAFYEHWRTRVLPVEANVKKAIVVDGEVVGNLLCFEMDGLREVGYWIGREHWGRGIATAALSTFLQGYRERPLWAHAASRNVASRRVLEKCGFAFAGAVREPLVSGAEEVDVSVFRLD